MKRLIKNKVKKLKKIPYFKYEKEESLFWQKVDSTDYVSFDNFKKVQFPNLKLSTRPITIRLPIGLINLVKIKAHKMDVPYQSLIKQSIFESFVTT